MKFNYYKHTNKDTNMSKKKIDTEKTTLENKFPHTKAFATRGGNGWRVVYSDGDVGNTMFKTKAEAEREILFYLDCLGADFWVTRPEIHSAIRTFFSTKDWKATASELESIIRTYLTPVTEHYESTIPEDAVDWLLWELAELGEVYR